VVRARAQGISYERVTRTGLPKRASYDPTDAGVDIASNTLACFSARLGLLPQLSDRQATVLGHIAKRWGLETPVRDAFVDWRPRIIRAPAPSPRVRTIKPGGLARRLGRHDVVLRTGEVVTLLELLEAGLQARGAGRRSPVRILRDAAASCLAEIEDGSNDENNGDDDTPRH
jgi:hypothetical protein